MSESSRKPNNPLSQLVVWCISAPILAVWALVSVLPLFSLIGAWGDAVAVLIALAFLATSALGLVSAVLVYRLLLWNNTTARIASPETRTLRAVALSAYALVWMAFYAL